MIYIQLQDIVKFKLLAEDISHEKYVETNLQKKVRFWLKAQAPLRTRQDQRSGGGKLKLSWRVRIVYE